MLNLMKADVSQIFRGKGIYITLVALVALTLLLVILSTLFLRWWPVKEWPLTD